MPLDESLRIGAGNVEYDNYGGDFSSAVDSGKTSEEGIEFAYKADKKKVKSAQNITVEEVFLIAEEATLKFGLKKHVMENLALSFAHESSEIVDDAVSSPKTKTLEFGGRRTLPIKAWRIKIPQPADPTLYDHIIIYRGQLSANFSQTYTYQNERYIPVEVECLGDDNNSGKLGKVVSEYA